jgi:hypothetical protein
MSSFHKVIRNIKAKKIVKLFVCWINSALCPEDMWGNGGTPPLFMTSALDGGEWSALRSGIFKPENELQDPLDIRLCEHQEPVWTLLRGEKSCPHRASNPKLPDSSPSIYRLSYPDFLMRKIANKIPNRFRIMIMNRQYKAALHSLGILFKSRPNIDYCN